MSEQRKYRKLTAKRKAEIVLAGLRGDRSVRDVCREHGIAETLYYSWREKLLEGGTAALNGKDERATELKKKIEELERALGPRDLPHPEAEESSAAPAAQGRGGDRRDRTRTRPTPTGWSGRWFAASSGSR